MERQKYWRVDYLQETSGGDGICFSEKVKTTDERLANWAFGIIRSNEFRAFPRMFEPEMSVYWLDTHDPVKETPTIAFWAEAFEGKHNTRSNP